MKKIGLFIPLMMILAACGPSENTVDITRVNSVIKAASAAQVATQGLSEVGHWQSLILILLVLFLVVPFVLAVCVFIRCFILWKYIIWPTGSGQWIGEFDTQWKKSEEPDLYQQIQLDQQWLFSQLLSQGQDEADPPELPIDWWG